MPNRQDDHGQLLSATGTGASDAVVFTREDRGVWFLVSKGGGTAGVSLQVSPDGGATWFTPPGATYTVSGTTDLYTLIDNPTGWWRANVTTYTSGTINVWYAKSQAR